MKDRRLRRGHDPVARALASTIALVMGFIVFGLLSTSQVASDAEQLVSEPVELLEQGSQLQVSQLEKRFAVDGYVDVDPTDRAVERASYETAASKTQIPLAAFAESESYRDGGLLDAVDVSLNEMAQIESRLFELVDAGRVDEARDLLNRGYVTATGSFDIALDALLDDVRERLDEQGDKVIGGALSARVTVAIVLSIILLILGYLTYLNRERKREALEKDAEKDAFASTQVRRARMRAGFEMSLTDSDALATFGSMLEQELPDWRSELLLADSSTAHLHRAVSTNPQGEPACCVARPTDCPAIRRSGTLQFDQPDDYDSCPNLRGRDLGGGTAICVPVKIMGKSIGIVHAIAPGAPSDAELEQLSEIAQVGGDRLGVLRAFATTNRRAEHDPLTGLFNRRAIEEQLMKLDAAGRSYSVAFCDLDHFKQLNDKHGHSTGDRALRAFSDTLRKSLRDVDLVARWGGEEFVVVLPDAAVDQAADSMNRVRDILALANLAGTLPSFTFSAGVAAADKDFETAVAAADAALLEAKRLGRDRVLIASTLAPHHQTDSPPEQPELSTSSSARR